MSHRRFLLGVSLLALCAAASGSGALAASPRAAKPTPRPVSTLPVSLRLSDLPKGYKQTAGVVLTNADMARLTRVPEKQFAQHGRLGGYEAQFTRPSSRGLGSASSFSSLYSTASGVMWDFAQSTRADLKTSTRTSGPRIGDQSVALFQSQNLGKAKIVAYGLDFRRGRYDVSVSVAGYAGQVTLAQAVHYARLLNSRIH